MTFPIQIHYGTLADSCVSSDAFNVRMTGHVMTNQELPLLKFMEQAHGLAEVTSVIRMMSTSMIIAKPKHFTDGNKDSLLDTLGRNTLAASSPLVKEP